MTDKHHWLEPYLRQMTKDQLVRVLLRFADYYRGADIARAAWEVRLDDAQAKADELFARVQGPLPILPHPLPDDPEAAWALVDRHQKAWATWKLNDEAWDRAMDETRRLLDAGPPRASDRTRSPS